MLDQAERCRRLAREHYDREITSRLEALATAFEQTAAELALKRG